MVQKGGVAQDAPQETKETKMFEVGEKVRVGNGKAVYTIVSVGPVSAELRSEKQSMCRRFTKLTKVS